VAVCERAAGIDLERVEFEVVEGPEGGEFRPVA